jgi:hypothetical protein
MGKIISSILLIIRVLVIFISIILEIIQGVLITYKVKGEFPFVATDVNVNWQLLVSPTVILIVVQGCSKICSCATPTKQNMVEVERQMTNGKKLCLVLISIMKIVLLGFIAVSVQLSAWIIDNPSPENNKLWASVIGMVWTVIAVSSISNIIKMVFICISSCKAMNGRNQYERAYGY